MTCRQYLFPLVSPVSALQVPVGSKVPPTPHWLESVHSSQTPRRLRQTPGKPASLVSVTHRHWMP